jgi:hypothetical protein
MLRNLLVSAVIAAGIVAAAEPLPELHTEAVPAGSVFTVKNGGSQPLTAFLIELVNYPGSYYAYWHDEVTAPLAPGAEKKIQVTNMTVGAVPDYVKITAAIFADGSTAGGPEKVTQMVGRRRALLAAARELVERFEKADAKADLKQWADSLQPERKNTRSQASINRAAARSLVRDAIARLDAGSEADALAWARANEKALAASKPAL